MKLKVLIALASLVMSFGRIKTHRSEQASLVFTGDVSFGGAIRYFAEKGFYDYKETLTKVATYLQQADIAIGNYESPFIQRKDEVKENRWKTDDAVTLRSTLKSAPALRFAGYDILSIANNHLNDFKEISVNTTVRTIKSLGIVPLGYSYGRYDAPQVPVTKVIRGVKIAFLAYCVNTTLCWSRMEFSSGPAYYTKDAATRDVYELKKSKSPDIIVIFLHWGLEYIPLPSANQRQIAKAFASLNVSMVIGSHSHRIEKHCFHGNTLISYGLGNFVFPPYPGNGNDEIFNWALAPKHARRLRNESRVTEKDYEKKFKTMNNPTSKSMILRVNVNKHGIVNAEYLPVNIQFLKDKKLLQPTPATNEWVSVCGKGDLHCMDKGQTCI
ncbi:capsule biosynthesis protein CapA [Nematostella vectensis]|uniref:capsule biosynthesis protein CapA n=1 Tax=Nematostella vectensis TaxID=45351 RepID=UPI002076DBE0|nr:capsule biosynthesis protein CapA [Nematostella vectensis]